MKNTPVCMAIIGVGMSIIGIGILMIGVYLGVTLKNWSFLTNAGVGYWVLFIPAITMTYALFLAVRADKTQQ